MDIRPIAVVIPYTDSRKILLQDRHSMKKFGEEWGFWGGRIEEGETAEQAAHREIQEELAFTMDTLQHIGKAEAIVPRFQPPHEKWLLRVDVFVTKVSEDERQFTVREGDGLGFFTIAEARKLVMAPKIDEQILDLVVQFLSRSTVDRPR